MKARSFENAKWYALVGSLAAILMLLAVLQYQSSKQVSRATADQMLTNLEASVANMRRGIESELAPLCRELQQSELQRYDAVSHENYLPGYARGFERWKRTAAHPALVSAVYIWQSDGVGSTQFFQLDSRAGDFKPTEWPADFVQIRQKLQSMTETFDSAAAYATDADGPQILNSRPGLEPPGRLDASSQPGALTSALSTALASPAWMIDENVPVLVHPTLAPVRMKDSQGGKVRSYVTWVLVVLNLDVLRSHILPELAQRNFGTEELSRYEVAVIQENAGTRGVIYSSDPAFSLPAVFVPDATLNLFGRPIPIVGRERIPVQVAMPTGNRPLGKGPNRRLRPSGPPPGQRDDEPFRIEPIRYHPEDRGWELIAKHHKGSVEAAVASLYHRNLAFNFCVLIVLAVTMGVIGVNSRRARRLARLQMDFVASVSHELRTPLTGIVAAAQNIADGIVDDKARVSRYGSAILSQAQQLTELVEQILLFSATDKDRHRYHVQPVSVDKLVESALSNTAVLIRSSRVTVERRVQPGLPCVLADSNALSQCLQNLIVNAVKYGGDQHWVGITATEEESHEQGKEIAISVQDRGIGIGRQELKHIFEPFYRSPAATAAQIRGTGLGLPLAKSIAEAMGGRLTVDSVPQTGSTFTIHLPVANHEGMQDVT